MLPQQYRRMLELASESGDPERLESTIRTLKFLAPQYFFKLNKDGKDDDPSMGRRVFFHRPFSFHWSGDYVTDKNAYEGNK